MHLVLHVAQMDKIVWNLLGHVSQVYPSALALLIRAVPVP